ncbi:MAG TPA: MFS transporter [Tepidisphaeraceae bacterium]|jgi:fucose permease|nr:MFS transporter [Tepidisphaeraceae bacterium]
MDGMHMTLSPRAKAWAVVLCDLAMMALAVAINLFPIFLTSLSHDIGGAKGLTKEQLGRIGAVSFSGLVLGIITIGPLADRLGGRVFAVGGNVLIAIGLVFLGRARGYDMLLASAFVLGLGAGTLDLVLSPMVSALEPDRRTAAMNLLHSFYCIGAVATILLGVLALRFGVSWRTVAQGLVPFPLVLAAFFLLAALPPMVHPGEARTPIKSMLIEPFFLAGMIAIFLGGATELGMAYWLPDYAEKTLGFSRWWAGMGFLGFSLGMSIGRIGVGFLPRSVGPIKLMLICSAASVVFFLLGSFSQSSVLALSCCVLVGFSGSCLWPSTLAVAADRFPLGGATMFAVLSMLGNLGGIVMPWIVGVVADCASLRLGLATATLCPLGLIPILLWMRNRSADVGPIAPVETAMIP